MNTSFPKITIVTPSYNQGHFLEATILSVLDQGYPNLEYFVMDGGSTDQSVEIIKKYSDRITYWVSEKDNGQADVIAGGLSKSTGEWFNWLNSDDILMPNALFALAAVVEANPSCNWISGAKINIDKNGFYGAAEIPWQTDPGVFCEGKALFAQDATFIRTSFLKKNSISLRPEYRYALDTTLYYELLKIEKPLLTSMVFSAMRWHEGQKSGQSERMIAENEKSAALYKTPLTVMQKILVRLSNTRLSPLVNALQKVMVYYGFLPGTRQWKAWMFDHWSNAYVLKEARKCVKY